MGPWLPYQMLCASWIGLGAGLLPRRVTGRAEIAMLVVYGIVCAYGFGMLMNLSSWPFVLGIAVPGHAGALSFVPGAPVAENLHRFAVYTLLTSTGGWDTGRAVTNSVAIVVLGPAVLATLRRASRRASYGLRGLRQDGPVSLPVRDPADVRGGYAGGRARSPGSAATDCRGLLREVVGPSGS